MIGAVHTDDVIKVFEIMRRHFARALAGEVIATSESGCLATPVWRFAHVPSSGASRIDRDLISQASISDHTTKNAFSGRRAADVPKTDE